VVAFFLGAVFFAATFLAAGFLAGLLAAVFLAEALTFFAGVRLEAVFFAALLAAATFFVFFFSVLALLAFFAFLAMIVLPIVAADFPTHRRAIKHNSLGPQRFLLALIAACIGPSHAFQRLWRRSTGRPIDQLDRMNDRN